jgi:ureidoglycolate lyase
LDLAVSLFEAAPQTLPFQVDLLEMHPKTEQLIMPLRLSSSGWIVLVAPDQDAVPDLGGAIALHLHPDEGIVYRAGVWHLPIFLKGEAPGLFLVQSMQDHRADDCVEYPLGSRAIHIVSSSPSSGDPAPDRP